MRRAWLTCGFMLGLAVAVVAQGIGIISPGQGIGPVRLGMDQAEITHALTQTGPCTVDVLYADGHAAHLKTSWGGCFMTAEGLQVGSPASHVVYRFGPPDDEEAEEQSTWLRYVGRGIAFLVVRDRSGDGVVIAIAIFPGLAGRLARLPMM
ncbi:MAG: hypothetical protein HY660_17825 [Armatimonadetes bacterium]|nr:hypothetical protein [Armatimonadota bacterium]